MLTFLYVIISLIVFAVMFGPTMCATIGGFFTTLIFVVLAVILAPFNLLFNRSHMRRSNELYEQMRALETSGLKYSTAYERLDKQYQELEAEITERNQSFFLMLLLIGVVLFLIWIIQIIIGLY